MNIRDNDKRYVMIVKPITEKPADWDLWFSYEFVPTYREVEREFHELRKGDMFRLYEPEGKAVWEEATGFVYAIADSDLERVEKKDGTSYLAIISHFVSPKEIFHD